MVSSVRPAPAARRRARASPHATDVVDAQIEAYRARDVERFLPYYADDACVVLFDGTPMFAGEEVMREQ